LEEIALRKEAFDIMKKELKYIGLLFLVFLVIFRVVFFKENLVVLFRLVLSLFWLFALPGYFMMLYWMEKIDFTERFIIGIVLAAGLIGIVSYYLGLAGLNLKYHAAILPLVLILAGIVINLKK